MGPAFPARLWHAAPQGHSAWGSIVCLATERPGSTTSVRTLGSGGEEPLSLIHI